MALFTSAGMPRAPSTDEDDRPAGAPVCARPAPPIARNHGLFAAAGLVGAGAKRRGQGRADQAGPRGGDDWGRIERPVRTPESKWARRQSDLTRNTTVIATARTTTSGRPSPSASSAVGCAEWFK